MTLGPTTVERRASQILLNSLRITSNLRLLFLAGRLYRPFAAQPKRPLHVLVQQNRIERECQQEQ